MGFFSKIFGRNDCSANYYVACSSLKYVFYKTDFSAEKFFNDLEFAKALVKVAVEMGKKSRIKIPKTYYNLPITFISNEDHSKFGYIVSFDDAKFECECNFVGMMIDNGKKFYYTNEFYMSDNEFGLCLFTSDEKHYFGIGNPQNYEEFKKAMIG